MRRWILAVGASGLLTGSYLAVAAPPVKRPAPAAPVISSHQIDRYDAIMKTKARLAEDPKSLADWIVLGELAHEVAMNLPEAQARDYVKTSREAYEKALALAPDNAGVRAAAQFARDLEANLDQFEKTRDQATETYLAARRRDLALSNYTPSVAVYNPPALPPAEADLAAAAPVRAPVTVPAPAVPTRPADPDEPVTNPPLPNDRATDTATYGARLLYGTAPTYQAFTSDANAPYTYQQYSSSYYPPGYYTNPAVPPVSLQRYRTAGLPGAVVTPPVRPR
jgi:hypothetical protein